MKPSKEEIAQTVEEILQDILKGWGVDDEELSSESMLFSDLGFSSVDALEIMASLDMKFQRKLPYEKLVMKDGAYVDDLSIGELVDFIDTHFDDAPQGPQPA